MRNCRYVVTQDGERRVLRNASIAIEDGEIIDVDKEVDGGDEVVDCSRLAAVPALVNAHCHLGACCIRGLADDLGFWEWIGYVSQELEPKLTRDAAYMGALAGCVELIRSGVSAVFDAYLFPREAVRAVSDAGLRGVIGYGVMEDPRFGELSQQISNAEKFVREVQALKNPRISPAIAPHSLYKCEEDALLRCVDLAKRYSIPLTMHVAETRREQADFEKSRGVREVEYLDNLGALGRWLVAVHCVWLTMREVKLLAEREARVCHCPTSNMKLAIGGTAPVHEMVENGVVVSLGTDGAGSSNSLNMYEVMKFCSLLSKHHLWNAAACGAQVVLDMATVNGAEALGLSGKIGEIRVGARADIALIDLSKAGYSPVLSGKHLVSHIVYSPPYGAVDTLLVDGVFVMRGGKVLTVDEDEVFAKLQEVCEEVFSAK